MRILGETVVDDGKDLPDVKGRKKIPGTTGMIRG